MLGGLPSRQKDWAVRIPSASAREDSLKPRDLCSLRSFFLRLNKQEKHDGNGQPSWLTITAAYRLRDITRERLSNMRVRKEDQTGQIGFS